MAETTDDVAAAAFDAWVTEGRALNGGTLPLAYEEGAQDAWRPAFEAGEATAEARIAALEAERDRLRHALKGYLLDHDSAAKAGFFHARTACTCLFCEIARAALAGKEG